MGFFDFLKKSILSDSNEDKPVETNNKPAQKSVHQDDTLTKEQRAIKEEREKYLMREGCDYKDYTISSLPIRVFSVSNPLEPAYSCYGDLKIRLSSDMNDWMQYRLIIGVPTDAPAQLMRAIEHYNNWLKTITIYQVYNYVGNFCAGHELMISGSTFRNNQEIFISEFPGTGSQLLSIVQMVDDYRGSDMERIEPCLGYSAPCWSMAIELTRDKYTEITSLLNNHFSDVIKSEKEKAQEIFDKAQMLLADSKVRNIVFQFILQMNQSFFLDIDTIKKIDWFISKQYGKHNASGINYLLQSDELERSAILQVVGNKNWPRPYTRQIIIQNPDILIEFIEQFQLFIGILNDMDVVDNCTPIFVYTLLFCGCIECYSEKWEENHSGYMCEDKDLHRLAKELLEKDEWIGNSERDVVQFTYFLMKHECFEDNWHIIRCYEKFNGIFLVQKDIYGQELAKKRMKKLLENPMGEKKVNILDIDLMTGVEFEKCIGDLFTRKGYSVSYTKATGDQGIDVIAEKDGYKLGIQAKRYTGSVGNAAVQEAVAGKQYYGLDKVMVITNSAFTQAAIDLANANDIVLWDREVLKENL